MGNNQGKMQRISNKEHYQENIKVCDIIHDISLYTLEHLNPDNFILFKI